MMTRLLLPVALFLATGTVTADQGAIRTTPLKGTVTLTFDDGPNPLYTPQILAILKKNHIHANFFMVGANAEHYPELVRQVQKEGHNIGNHSMTHPMLTRLSEKQLHYEVVHSEAILEGILHQHPTCLRPPFGMSNTRVHNYILAQNITPVPMGWNSFDYTKPGVQKIINQVLHNAHNGQVFLLHDGYADRAQTVAALQPIIDGIRAKGLGFSTICN